MSLGAGSVTSAPAKSVRFVAPAQGDLVKGPNVTITVDSSGLNAGKHVDMLVDGTAMTYALGSPIRVGYDNFYHMRTKAAATKFAPGPHIVVLFASNDKHVPMRPLVVSSLYFFVTR